MQEGGRDKEEWEGGNESYLELAEMKKEDMADQKLAVYPCDAKLREFIC